MEHSVGVKERGERVVLRCGSRARASLLARSMVVLAELFEVGEQSRSTQFELNGHAVLVPVAPK
jgi:hypothetical protein